MHSLYHFFGSDDMSRGSLDPFAEMNIVVINWGTSSSYISDKILQSSPLRSNTCMMPPLSSLLTNHTSWCILKYVMLWYNTLSMIQYCILSYVQFHTVTLNLTLITTYNSYFIFFYKIFIHIVSCDIMIFLSLMILYNTLRQCIILNDTTRYFFYIKQYRVISNILIQYQITFYNNIL